MARAPVWIAGIGAVSAAGDGIAATLASFREGRRNVAEHLPFQSDISCPTFQAAAKLPSLPDRRNGSRSLRLTMRAAAEALASARFDAFAGGARVGVCLGTTVASQLNSIPFYDAYRRTGNPPLDALSDYLNANLAEAVGDLLRVSGPRLTVVNACSSGADAIGVAREWILAGLCDAAICGGGDEINRVALAGFWSLGVTSSQPCAPFDRDRAGLNLGEGAGILVLESDSQARRRGMSNRFQLVGFGAACDAHHLTAPHPDGRGLESSINTALAEAGLTPSDIAFINAHGTATLDNDRSEGKVLRRLFGDKVPVLSTKGFTGHALGAAGGLEAAFTVLGLREGWIPASAGFASQADDIPIAPVRQRTEITGSYAMSTSLAFGGNNAALIIRRVDE
ncbi:MAG TPA: beta-ketoacyl-[acyl-carrier-protein] synthase family protein [Tepidisphaeraceae bacterium]|nr:beta-ketoacyl-[acyl-carrier-protein] synthase family protein [Tepidisphaeraceae bacterium]